MKHLLFLSLLLTTVADVFGQEKVQLSPAASVVCECSPERETLDFVTIYACERSSIIYQALLVDFRSLEGFDFVKEDLDEFYRGYIDGQSEKVGAEPFNERKVIINTQEGREFSMIVTINNQTFIWHNRFILKDKICYSLVCVVPNKKKRKFQKKSREFFNTFELLL